jgi:predicted porin
MQAEAVKRSLVALGAMSVAGVGWAQPTVALSGFLKGGVAHTRYSGAAAGNGSGTALADGGSRFALSGREDLGGGLSALFQVETRLRVDDNGPAPAASPLANGNTFVGLAGGFGQVRIGKLDTHFCLGADEHGSRATALQASSCGLLGFVGGVANPIAVVGRTVNLVRYDVPANWVRGLTGGVGYSTGFTGNDGAVGDAGKGRAMTANAGYASGPLRLGASYWSARSEDRSLAAARTNQDAWTLSANWDFGFARAGLTFDRSAHDRAAAGVATFTESSRRAWSVPVTVGLGAGTLLLTYTRAQELRVGGTGAAGTGARLWSIGYDRALSRRTSLGVSYANLANGAAATYQLYQGAILLNLPAPAAGQDIRQFYVGVRHSF